MIYTLSLSIRLNCCVGTIMNDSAWAAPCCGVVTEWQASIDQFAFDTLHLQIWSPVNPASGQFRLKGEITQTSISILNHLA